MCADISTILPLVVRCYNGVNEAFRLLYSSHICVIMHPVTGCDIHGALWRPISPAILKRAWRFLVEMNERYFVVDIFLAANFCGIEPPYLLFRHRGAHFSAWLGELCTGGEILLAAHILIVHRP